MKEISYIDVVLFVLVVIAAAYYFLKKKESKNTISSFASIIKKSKHNLYPLSKSKIDRELSLNIDIVSYFKQLSLNPKKQTPFMIKGNCMTKFFSDATDMSANSLIVGVYNEDSNTITDLKVIEGTSMDAQLQNILKNANDGIVVLN
jgi:hypothetical protein